MCVRTRSPETGYGISLGSSVAYVVAGNLAVDASEVLLDGKLARVWSIVETGVLTDDASEYRVYGVPKLGTVVLFECALTPAGQGTATTVDPRIGKVAAFAVDTIDELAVNVKASAHIRNGRPVPFFASAEEVVVRSRPNGTADEVRTTIVVLAGLCAPDGLKGDWQRGPNDRAGVPVRAAAVLTQAYVASLPLDVFGFTWVDFTVRLVAAGGVTRVDARVSLTNDPDPATANWTLLQTESVSAGVATLSDYVVQKAVIAAVNIPVTVPVRGRFMRIEVLGAGTVAQSSCSITALRRKD